MIKVIVNGASGRMGSMATAAVEQDPELQLVAKLGRKDNLAQQIKDTQADVVIDLTTASSVYENTTAIIEAGARPVIGTSGLVAEQIKELQQLCSNKQLGGIIGPNFSIGGVLMMKYAEDAAKYLPDVEIIELHHNKKEDSPSGTAIKTSEMIAAHASRSLAPRRETIPGARGASHHNIAIHAIRLPGLMAHQEVIFGSTGETLRIRHDSISRECFMPGILLATKKVMGLDSLVYGLENIL